MTRQNINIGSQGNDSTGDPLRTAFEKVNNNFVELYDSSSFATQITISGNSISSNSSNANLVLQASGTGAIEIGGIQISDNEIQATRSNDDLKLTSSGTGAVHLTNLKLATGATVTGIDNGALGSSATLLATQGAIKTYVDAQNSAQTITIVGDDSTGTAINTGETFTITGGTGLASAVSGDTMTLNIDATVATLVGSQTLTNKVLTAPTINGASLTGTVTVDNLTFNDNIISSSSNADINITPSGTGSIVASGLSIKGTSISAPDSSTVNINEGLNVDGTVTVEGNTTVSGSLTTGTFNVGDLNIDASGKITTDTNGDVNIDPSGTGAIVLTGPISHTGTQTTSGQLNVDNLRLDGNVLSATSGGITLTPATGQNVSVNGLLTASEANFTLMEATTVRADTIQNDTSDGDLSINTQGTGNINVNSLKIINLQDPSGNQDAATKAYVDSQAGGSANIGDITFVGSTIISPSNADITLDPAGTGLVRINTDKIALGSSAGATSQGADSVAIGKSAGSSSQGTKSVAIGDEAGTTSQGQRSVAIGRQAGNNTQGEYAVAVGSEAGEITQGADSVAMGRQAGYDQGSNAVHVGGFAGGGAGGSGYGPGTGSVGIGYKAGVNSQSNYAIAMGYEAGVTSQGTNAIAIGKEASNSGGGGDSIAIGYNAMKSNSTAAKTTAIGYEAARSNTVGGGSDRAIAIGYRAGYSTLHPNSIVLNAHNGELNTVGTSRFYVKPVRSASGNSQPLLRYDASSGEISFMPHIEINDNLIQAVQTNADLELSGNGTGATKINGKLVISASQADGSSVAIDTTKSVAVLAGNSGADDNEYTLADGTTAGQIMYLVRGPNSNRESIHVTFSKFENDGTTASNTRKEMFSQYMSVITCIWNGSAWCVAQHV
mgnify:CR=1 FL=1